MQNIRQAILGAWRLVHSKGIDKDGKVSYPFGADAIGYIVYSESGIMAVQISRKIHRGSSIAEDYLAYFGRYEIDEEKHVIKHFLEGQLVAGRFADKEERRYELNGNRLSLKPVGNLQHEILWQRT
jgi:hypothetical protein